MTSASCDDFSRKHRFFIKLQKMMLPTLTIWRLCSWTIVAGLFILVCHLIPSSPDAAFFPIARSHLANWGASAAREELPSQHQNLEGARSSGRVAICLVGGARAFELTGPSINKHVFHSSGPDSDVFLNVPMDNDTFKLFLLKNTSNVSFASARIFRPQPLEENDEFRSLLTAAGSPHGIQGLLQYFNLVEGCWNLVTKYEEEHKVRYDLILRTRVDGFWNGRLPALETLDRTAYTVPQGSHFGGLNDRLGVGNRNTSMVALLRLSSLHSLHSLNYKNLNSETAFKAQLESTNTSVRFRGLPFCVMTSRKYDWPPGEWGVPVMALSSRGPLNGAKCRPCVPKIVGDQAKSVVQALNRGWGWTDPSSGVELCDSRTDWEDNWETAFDELVGEEGRRARLQVARITRPSCVLRMKEFSRLWKSWEAPSAEEICGENERNQA